nr:hypothetical protein [Tanacetum cinerariifolium]
MPSCNKRSKLSSNKKVIDIIRFKFIWIPNIARIPGDSSPPSIYISSNDIDYIRDFTLHGYFGHFVSSLMESSQSSDQSSVSFDDVDVSSGPVDNVLTSLTKEIVAFEHDSD